MATNDKAIAETQKPVAVEKINTSHYKKKVRALCYFGHKYYVVQGIIVQRGGNAQSLVLRNIKQSEACEGDSNPLLRTHKLIKVAVKSATFCFDPEATIHFV